MQAGTSPLSWSIGFSGEKMDEAFGTDIVIHVH